MSPQVLSRVVAGAVCGALALTGCRDGKPPGGGGASPAAPGSTEEAGGPGGSAGGGGGPGGDAARVRLAESPRIDLLANRHRWHLHRDGLVVPLAGEGLRKYTQEYAQPWGRLVEHDGRTGRVLSRRAATLRIPWRGAGPATARLWVHGLTAGQRVELKLNGRRAGIAAAPAGWTELVIPVAADLLREGENEIAIHVARAGRAGGVASHALFHSLELVPGEALAAGNPPPLDPVARVSHGAEREALSGLARLVLYVEIPPGAWLRLATGGEGARFRATARGVEGEPRLLLEADGAASWTEHQVSLAPLADELVALELAVEGQGAWAEPVIALEEAPVAPAPPAYRNLILVVVDALRSDRLALYGETRVRTPRITAEGKKRGVVFLNNQAASPSSPPSHGSIQTGMIPRVHGVAGDSGQLVPGTPTVSTQLGDAGVATAYFGNNPFGMARLEKPGRWTAFHQPAREGKGIDCTAMVPMMLDFARAQREAGKRFFISSLPYEPHTPYRYHEGISDRFHPGPWGPPVGKSVDGNLLSALSSGKVKLSETQWQQLFALYDGEVEYFDGCFAQLLDGLAEMGAAADTAIVLTSDHGEGMFEHGRMGHAFGHYRELGDVPLVVIGEGLTPQPRTIPTVTSHLDITPTILALMGVEPDRRVQGRSVVPLIRRQGPWTPRVMPLEYGRSYALRARRYKLIVDYNGAESLFDLEADPTEQTDIAGRGHLAERYLRDLAGFFLAHRSDWRMAEFGPLNDHTPAFVEHAAKRARP